MPPKVRITREMIIDAAFELTRENGIDNVNARTVAERIGCSTQPIMYCFKTIEELKAAVYEKIDTFHTEYLMKMDESNPMMSIGINYIRFAATQKNLFKTLFQTDKIAQKDMIEIIDTEDVHPIIEVLQQEVGVDENGARTIFSMLAFFTHGYASLLANNSLQYDEESVTAMLSELFDGACAAQVMKQQEQENNKN